MTAAAGGVLPYIGLRPFDEADQRLFFGREEQISTVLTLLEDDAFLAVVGSSGSGKSSLVRAGLVPLVREGFLLGCARWQVAIAKPGNHPFEALAEALAEGAVTPSNLPPGALKEGLLTVLRTEGQALQQAHRLCGHGSDDGLLVVVDQFEELFAYRRGAAPAPGAVQRDEGAAFVRMLLRGAADRLRPLRVIITMRSDFIGDCEAFLGLPEKISRSQFLVPRLDRAQMERVILGPAQLDGDGLSPFGFEDGLVNGVINDAGDRPDQLPLLQHALMQTWKTAQRRHGGGVGLRLELDDYHTAGGVLGALSNHADAALAELDGDPPRQALVRRLFLLLAEVSAQGQLTRRRPLLGEVEQATGATRAELRAIAHVFQKDDRNFLLPAAEALDSDAVTLDISHESLLRRWHRFQRWLDEEERDATELRDWLRRARQRGGAGSDGGDGADLGENGENGEGGESTNNSLSDADNALATAWRKRIAERGHPECWALRYTGAGSWAEVDAYISASRSQIAAAKLERRRVKTEREELRRQALAERDKRLADAVKTERVIRRQRHIAVLGALVALVFGFVALAFWSRADDSLDLARAQTRLAQSLASEAQANELATTAESLRREHPDLSALLALEARRLHPESALARAVLRAVVAVERPRLLLRGHQSQVTAVQFSADGKQLLSASVDGTARLWDVASGRPLAVLAGHLGPINSARFAADGQTVVTVSDDFSAMLWNAATGAAIQTLGEHDLAMVKSADLSADGKTVLTLDERGTVRLWNGLTARQLGEIGDDSSPQDQAHLAPDGRWMLAMAQDGSVRTWDVASGKPLRLLGGKGLRSAAVALSADGRWVLTGGQEDGVVRLWDAASGRQRLALQGHEGEVSTVQFSGNGQQALSAGADGKAVVWNLATGRSLQVFDDHDGVVRSASLSANGRAVLTRDDSGTVRLWDVASARLHHIAGGHENAVAEARLSPDGSLMATVISDKSLGLWDAASSSTHPVLQGHTGPVTTAQFAADGRTLLTESYDRTARLWDAATGQPLRVLGEGQPPVYRARLSPDGKSVLTTGGGDTATLWDAASGAELRVLRGHQARVTNLQFTRDSQFVLTLGDDKTARVWNVATGAAVLTLGSAASPLDFARFTRDGKALVTLGGPRDGGRALRLWDIASNQERAALTGIEGEIRSLRLSPDGSTVAYGSTDHKARLWHLASKRVTTLGGHEGSVLAVRFSNDGRKILSTSADSTARLWEAASGRELKALRGHHGPVLSGEFSDDGQTVLSVGEDRTARLWDVGSGIELAVLSGHRGRVMSAQFGPDGATVVTTGYDGTARLWPCKVCRARPELAQEAARWVGRELSDAERAQYGLVPTAAPATGASRPAQAASAASARTSP
ncbi:WD-40 repeat protein [Rubrivivax sp. A210]|uniref:WD40 repeat domain-containing protein n=1 Tax=Rubrivivax sp. A210 TaxID=2772301 RepID=UPI0019185015|nr:WD40 repeat domain-containing protein [Rubrivivax sp. A210]CAD5369783.1 WD-40 repeat protein [Rubrivivax sp. A210]